MKITKLFAGAALSAVAVGALGGVAGAGEITGNDTSTPVQEFRAASECSFSGLDEVDGSALGPDDADDALFGRTQSFGQIVRQFGGQSARGGAGAACSPGNGPK